MASLALYWIPGSCARVPFVALEEAGAEFELRPINRYRGEHETAAYRAINPKGKVPALVVDETVVTEVPVVVQKLARLFPEAGLLPRGEEDEIEALSLMAWFASSLHPSAGMQRFPNLYSDDATSLEGIRSKARADLRKGFTILESRFADGREWLFGRWSIVDVYAFYIWFRVVGSGFEAGDFPLYAAHARRCEQRPSVARVLDREEAVFAGYEAEGLLPENLPAHQAGRLPAWLMGLPDA
jgi:glutathione S-transferase